MVDIVQKKIATYITYLRLLNFGTTKKFMCKSENYGKSGLNEKIPV